MIDPASVDYGSRSSGRAAKSISKFFDKMIMLWSFYAPAARNDDLGFGQVDLLPSVCEDIRKICANRIDRDRNRELNNFSVVTLFLFFHWEDVRASREECRGGVELDRCVGFASVDWTYN